MIAFTCDIDWAHDEIIADTLSIFEKYGTKCTLFSTHHTQVLTESNRKLFEIAVHPNLNSILYHKTEKSVSDILDEMIDSHPHSKGIRTHTMIQSTDLFEKFSEKGFIYDSNMFLPYQKGLKPFKLWNGLVEIPFNWEDEVHWTYGYSFDDCRLELTDECFVVFDFHPIHIFLNTENKYRYTEAKKFRDNPAKLREYVNKDLEVKGTRDLLKSLLERCRQNKFESKTLLEIANEVIHTNP